MAFARALARVEELTGRAFDPRPTLVVRTREEWVAQVRSWHAPPVDGDEDGDGSDEDDESGDGEAAPSDPYGVLFVTLGIVPARDAEQRSMAAVMEHNQGYYDRDAHEVTFITDAPRARRDAALGHALIHALQTQTAPFYVVEDDTGRADDVRWAYVAAAEAEGVLADLAWPAATLDPATLAPEVERLPVRLGLPAIEAEPYALRWTYWSYVAGCRLGLARLRALADAGEATTIATLGASLRKRPPVSTEQVHHPERGDAPRAVFAPDLAAVIDDGTLTLVMRSVLGEWTLADWVRAVDATAAPGGEPAAPERLGGGLPDDLRWGGDLVQAYHDGERWAVIVWTEWDDEASARRFEAILGGADAVRGVRSGRRVVASCGPDVHPSREALAAALASVESVPFASLTELERIVADRED